MDTQKINNQQTGMEEPRSGEKNSKLKDAARMGGIAAAGVGVGVAGSMAAKAYDGSEDEDIAANAPAPSVTPHPATEPSDEEEETAAAAEDVEEIHFTEEEIEEIGKENIVDSSLIAEETGLDDGLNGHEPETGPIEIADVIPDDEIIISDGMPNPIVPVELAEIIEEPLEEEVEIIDDTDYVFGEDDTVGDDDCMYNDELAMGDLGVNIEDMEYNDLTGADDTFADNIGDMPDEPII